MIAPVEIYDGIYVKRDDLCYPPPAPPFSKCRGVLQHLMKLRREGVKTVGYTETSISMAGWGVAWACFQLDMQAVIFDPQYKVTPELLKYHRSRWEMFGAKTVPIMAGRAKVNYYLSKKYLEGGYPNSVMLPLGLPFDETIEATRAEVHQTITGLPKIRSVVVCVGSGTIFTGIYKGLHDIRQDFNLYGVLSRTGNVTQKTKKICQKSGIVTEGFWATTSKVGMQLIDPGWQYTEQSLIACPFPCHPYYDLKAWEWLHFNREKLKKPILFWNIGNMEMLNK